MMNGKASHYIHHLDELPDEQGRKFILYIRVSSRSQHHNKNLDQQEAELREAVEWIGGVVINVYREVGSGWDLDVTNRGELAKAAKNARKRNAVLLASSTDRFIRSNKYHSKNNPSAQPTCKQFDTLREITQGVQLFTMHHPDLNWRGVRSEQSKRGQQSRNKKGGRPPKRKQNQKGLLSRVMKYYSKVRQERNLGHSYREIASSLDLPLSTVYRWVQDDENAKKPTVPKTERQESSKTSKPGRTRIYFAPASS